LETLKIQFTNSKGLTLSGYVDLPEDKKPIAYAVFAHCFTCSKDLKAIGNINSSLAKEGIAVLRFDFTGIGESEGEFSDSNYSDYLSDLFFSTEFLSFHYEAPKILIGHSLGGCIAIESAGKITSVNAVIVIGTPAEPSMLSAKLRITKENAESEGIAETEIGGIKYKFKKQFFEDLETHRLEPYIRNLGKPLMVMHSPIDSYTPFEDGEKIFKTAGYPKNFITLDKVDHLMLNKEDALYTGSVIAAWVKKYI
jgi:alpha/beta superfamily hydrolase